MLQSTVDEIKGNLIYVLDEVVHSRQYLNKHFQNSMNNYFLENYATLPCLKKRFDTQSGRQVRKEIFEKYNAIQEAEGKAEGNLKCFLIMRGFIEEHKLNNSLKEYRASLTAISNASTADSNIKQGSSEWISLQWRRLFALMVLHHTFYPEIMGVYELWFHVFDERLIARERQKKKKEEIVYKKGMTPYIISSKVEETEQSASPLPKDSCTNPSLIVRGNEGSLSSILSNDEQHTQCSIDSPKSPPSLMNISKNKDKIKERVSKKKMQVKVEKESEEKEDNEDAEEPSISKKRITQDTIVLLKDRSNSQIELRNSSVSFLSSASQAVLNQNLGNEQTLNSNVREQNVNFGNQIQQQFQDFQSLSQQQQPQQQSQTSTAFTQNYLAQENQSQTPLYQNNHFSSIENKQEYNESASYQAAHSHNQHNQSASHFYDSNNPASYAPYQFSLSHTNSQQDQFQMQRQSSNNCALYMHASSQGQGLERQQSANYHYEDNYNAYNYSQQQNNQTLIGQIQNNSGNNEPSSDYFMNCNQENYANSQYDHHNEELNKLKFESQSMTTYTSQNLDMQNQYQMQFKGETSMQNQTLTGAHCYNSTQQYNPPVNYRPHQHQSQSAAAASHHLLAKRNQSSQFNPHYHNGIAVNYEYNPYDSSYSSFYDHQSEYGHSSSTPSATSSSFSSFNSPAAACDENLQYPCYQNINQAYTHQQYNKSSFAPKADGEHSDFTHYSNPHFQQYQHQSSYMNSFSERNYISNDIHTDIFQSIKSEQL